MVKLREYVASRRNHPGRAERPQQSRSPSRWNELCRHMYPPKDYPDYKLRAAARDARHLHRHPADLEGAADTARHEQRLPHVLRAVRRVSLRRLANEPHRERRLQVGDQPAVLRHGPRRSGGQVRLDSPRDRPGQAAQGRHRAGPRPPRRRRRASARLGRGQHVLAVVPRPMPSTSPAASSRNVARSRWARTTLPASACCTSPASAS